MAKGLLSTNTSARFRKRPGTKSSMGRNRTGVIRLE